MIATKRAVSHAGEGSRSTHSSSERMDRAGYRFLSICELFTIHTLYTHFYRLCVYDVCKKEGDKMGSKIRVNISISENTHRILKDHAAIAGTNVSQIITNLIMEKARAGKVSTGYDNTGLYERIIRIGDDTDERLEQWAYENHTTVDQAITDWIWKQKVKENNIRGQLRFR